MKLSPEDVSDILSVLDSSDYDELHIDTGRFVLTLRREPGGWTQEQQVRAEPELSSRSGPEAEPAEALAARDLARSTAAVSANSDAGVSLEERSRPESWCAVVAPLPGVFYRAPKPGAAPFVEVGDSVEADRVVCILETMKLMNAVVAGADGEVAEICLDNGAPAEQGTVLIWVRPSSP